MRPEIRLLTLVGPPGIGKTRLGLEVAGALLEELEHGIYWVALAPLRDPGLVASAIAQAVGVRESGGRALLEAMGLVPWPFSQPFQEQAVAAARAALGADAFAATWAEGRALGLDEALEYALALAERATPTAAVQQGPPNERHRGPLTAREREVVALVARGLTNRQIADELVVAELTVDTHVRNIVKKLGVHSRAEVAARATEQGLLAPAPG